MLALVSGRPVRVLFGKHPWRTVAGGVLITLVTAGVISFTIFYLKYAHLVDAKLRSGVLQNASMLYAAPRVITAGQDADLDEIAGYLRRCGFIASNARSDASTASWYEKTGD